LRSISKQAVIRRRRQPARVQRVAQRAERRAHTSASIVALGLLLFIGTLVLYGPVRAHDFINFDDKEYVVENPHVNVGISWQTVRWSLTANEQANWHPVTWLSHALDCQLFGLAPGSHHLVNLVIHTLNVLLVFFLLHRATGALGPSFLVAALFAWHPLNVESVAWIAERKNVLSTLFFLLTIGAYGWYARRPGWKRHALMMGVFVLALASKPMVVTLPFALLLLDYWPLQRVKVWIEPSPRFSVPQQSVGRLVLEKVPLLVLSAAASAITLWVQKSDGATRSMQTFPLGQRLGNALLSYLLYVCKTFWPVRLSIFYPHPGPKLLVWAVILSAAILCAISVVVWRQRVARPFLPVGWFWFLGTLVPVIGIVQVGYQAMADRYAYVPLLGLCVMIAVGSAELFDRMAVRAELRWALAVIVLLTMASLSFRQLGYWQDGVSVWSHAMDVTETDAFVEKYLAEELRKRGDTDDAVAHLLEARNRDPEDIETLVNLGALHMQQSNYTDAIHDLESAIQRIDHDVASDDQRFTRTSALLNLGFAYALSKDYTNATASLQKAEQVDPNMVDQAVETMKRALLSTPTEGTYLNLALLLRVKGNNTEASSILQDAITEHPDYTTIQSLVGYLNSHG
jgi:tetratricopeptide (TPR) repeat protein